MMITPHPCVLALCLFASCAIYDQHEPGGAPDQRAGVVAVTGAFGRGDLHGSNGVHYRGPTFGARIDVGGVLGDSQVMLGGRAAVYGTRTSREGSNAYQTIDLDATQFAIGPLLHIGFGGEHSSVRPYIEFAAGFQHASLTGTITDVFAGSVSDSDSDSGLFYSAGGGLSFPMEDAEFLIGVEYLHSDLNDLDAEDEAVLGSLGFRFRF